MDRRSQNECIFEAENALDYGVESKSEPDDTVDDVLDMDSEVFPDDSIDENSYVVDSRKKSEKELKDEKYIDSALAKIELNVVNLETTVAG